LWMVHVPPVLSGGGPTIQLRTVCRSLNLLGQRALPPSLCNGSRYLPSPPWRRPPGAPEMWWTYARASAWYMRHGTQGGSSMNISHGTCTGTACISLRRSGSCSPPQCPHRMPVRLPLRLVGLPVQGECVTVCSVITTALKALYQIPAYVLRTHQWCGVSWRCVTVVKHVGDSLTVVLSAF
jgi:hypothetical protein